MKLFGFKALIFFLFIIGIIFPIKDVYAVPLSGTYTLASSGDYTSWQAFWNDVQNEGIGGDVTLNINNEEFAETTAPATITQNLNGYTLHIKPSNDESFPDSSDCNSGPRFLLNYSATDEFLELNMPGTGHVIIEGISVKVNSGSTSPTQVIYNLNQHASTVTIRRCVLKGQGDARGIAIYNPDVINKIYNNFIYGFDEGISLLYDLSSSSFLSNNTVYGCNSYGINAFNKPSTFKNNICYNNTTDFNSLTNATGYNNLSKDDTCSDANWSTGSNNRPSKTLTFTNPGNDKLLLSSYDTDAIDKGIGHFSCIACHFQAHYKLEPDNLTVDSSGNNNSLTAVGTITSSPSSGDAWKVGDGAVHFDNGEWYYRSNGNLSANFPGKSGGNNHNLTLGVWYRPAISANNTWAGIAGIWNGGTQAGAVWLVYKTNTNKVAFGKGWNEGSDVDAEYTSHDSALTCDGAHWYYIGVIYNDTTGGVLIRIWDETAGAILGVDKVDTHTQKMDDTTPVIADFRVNTYYYDGGSCCAKSSDMDDLRIYSDALTASYMDDLRNVRYETDAFGNDRSYYFDIGAHEYYPLTSGTVTLKESGGDYSSWRDFWNDLGALTGDITLLIDPVQFTETTAPAAVTENLNGYTLYIKPSSDENFPTSSDCSDGPRFITNYSATDEFLDLNMAGTGNVIIEGISVEVNSGSTTPTQILYSHPQNTCNVTIKRCVFKGQQDGDGIKTSDVDPIQKFYNNFLYDFDDAVYIDVNLSAGSFLSANTIYGCDNHGIDANSKSGKFENNIVYNCGIDSGFNSIGSAYGYNNLTGPDDNSCADGNWVYASGNLIDKTLTFTDAANNVFFLQSPECDDAINAGIGDFSSYDDNLQAHYKLEPDNLTVDSSGNNNSLTASGTITSSPSSGDYCKVDDGSVHFDDNEYYYINDGNLSSGFPGKQGSSNTTLSICFWYRPGSSAAGQWTGLLSKYKSSDGDNGKVWMIQKSDVEKIRLYIGYNGGAGADYVEFGTALSNLDGNHWYHIGASFNNSTKFARLRIWDETASALLGSDETKILASSMDTSPSYTPPG
ncbi:MAG: hypothetical protein AMJ42_01525 [Deltaproteobacteria bacterium DG_8]|nr:MAG: hypothetical protein AMJ42_01525 [Deltaproteobacteria bacterium DG_8]